MTHSPLRRTLLLAGVALPFASLTARVRAADTPSDILTQELTALETSSKGRLGLALINTGTGQEFQYRGDERFPFCSTFKLMLASAVLKKSMTQASLLTQHIAYSEEDLLSYAPITRKNLAQGMSVSELCAATLQYSDNTAANLLIKQIGGLEAVNHFAQSLGDRDFRLDRFEPDLNSALPFDIRDTTTPKAMANSLKKIALGNSILAPNLRAQLITWIKGNTTGDATIRAGAPSGWKVGDKTGSGNYGTTNDIGLLWPPSGEPVVLTIYFTQLKKDADNRRDVLAAATKLALSHYPDYS
ncbi:class A beta-lactamase [Aquirhabdus parva]|uniref:beta-lactamase n=1 Tax=Aquirhabdus parva TaxID=2283318 RepID=A0A345PBP9_9GAMM|nr:class A beta-lactamase [Aquirhabdus parva]AXI04708.1 class A beta-lactamase [Aquirhabdus parva]